MTRHVNVRSGKVPPIFENARYFDLFAPASGRQLGHLAGMIYENTFRVILVNVRRAERKLSPSEWKSVLDGLRNLLPEAVTEITGYRPREERGLQGLGEKKTALHQRVVPEIDIELEK